MSSLDSRTTISQEQRYAAMTQAYREAIEEGETTEAERLRHWGYEMGFDMEISTSPAAHVGAYKL